MNLREEAEEGIDHQGVHSVAYEVLTEVHLQGALSEARPFRDHA